MALALFLVTATGLGQFAPGFGWGSRSFAGWALLPLLLYGLSAAAGLPLHVAGWGVLALAVLGHAYALYRWRSTPDRMVMAQAALLHPIAVLSLCVVAISFLFGPNHYVPLQWDELSNWLTVTRQMFVADVVWRDDMTFNNPGYTPGWYLSMLYPNLFHEQFSEARSLAAFSAGWICFAGLAWDIISRATPEKSFRWLSLSGFMILFALSWLPSNLLIEPPQLLLTAAPFMLLTVAIRNRDDALSIAALAGLLLAAAIFLKLASILLLVLVPMLIWQVYRQGAWAAAGGVLVPPTVVYFGWTLLGSHGATAQCMKSPFDSSSWEKLEGGSEIVAQFFTRSFDFIAVWAASPTAIIGLIGLLVVFVTPSLRQLSIGVLMYLGVYFSAVLWSITTCFGGYDRLVLASLERYQALALDVVSTVGLLVVAIQLARTAPVVKKRLPHALVIAATIAALALIGSMTHTARLSAVRLATPFAPGHPFPPMYVERRQPILMGIDDLRTIAKVTRVEHGGPPRVTVIAQNSDGFERFLLSYLALGDKRGGPLQTFRVMHRHSWTAVSQHWSAATTKDQIRKDLVTADIIWPRFVDRFIGPVLAGFVDSEVCGNNIRAFMLWRSDPGAPYRCVLNEGVLRYYEQIGSGS